MKKTSICLLTIILLGLMLWISQNIVVTAGTTDYTVSGYILDANGYGIANVKVNFFFSSPPSQFCYTNDSGYYQLKTHSGINIVTITPPINTNYVKYIENSFNVVQANMTANFTLSLGYRLSGLVVDQNLKPIKSGAYDLGGVGIYLDSYFSGTWADTNGTYYVVAPKGNYTIHARNCQMGSWGSVGYDEEYTVLSSQTISLNSDTTANIIVNMLTSTQTPTPKITPTATSESTTTPEPAIPEMPAWLISMLGIMLVTSGLLFYFKNQRTNRPVSH